MHSTITNFFLNQTQEMCPANLTNNSTDGYIDLISSAVSRASSSFFDTAKFVTSFSHFLVTYSWETMNTEQKVVTGLFVGYAAISAKLIMNKKGFTMSGVCLVALNYAALSTFYLTSWK